MSKAVRLTQPMEFIVPSSIDVPFSSASDYAIDTPMGFRRQRYWFLSFVMTPFKDIDERANDHTSPRQPGTARGR